MNQISVNYCTYCTAVNCGIKPLYINGVKKEFAASPIILQHFGS